MKKTSIRFLAILLTVFLLVSIFPLSLFAANSSEDPPLNSSLPDESATPTEEESSQDRLPEESLAEVSQTEITGSLIPEEEPAPDGASTPNRAPAAAASFTTLSETVLPDGIYAFRNLGNTNRWMDVEQNRTTPGYHIQQYAYSASPAEEYGAAGLFKVTQVGTTGRYIIRLMLNTNLTFGFSGDEVITKTIPASDASVSASDTFYIRYNNGGFTIQPSNNSTYYVAANNTTASGMGGAPDSYLAKRTLSAAGNRARWAAEGYQTQIPNGVYAFRNLGNTNRWMDVQNNGTDPGYRIQQYAYGSSPAGGFNRPGLFKVSQIGSTGRYVVRLMLNNELSFGFSGTGVVTKKIPASDASVSTSDTFYINFNNGSYVIRPASETENYVAANNTTASGAGGAPDSYLAKRTLSSAGDRARWILERYTGSSQYGYIPSISAGHSQNLVAGEQVEISLKVWSTVINVNTPYISVNSGSSYVTTSWNSSSNKLSVLARDAGTVQLKLEVRNSSSTIYNSDPTPYTLNIKLPFEEGIYLFQNKDLGKYMQIDDNGLSKTDLNGVNMELWGLSGKSYQHWRIIHVGEGYYKILSAHCGLAVGVSSSYVNKTDKSLLLEEYYNSNRQKWKITKTSSGSYVLRPQSGEAYSTDWCMAASDGVDWTSGTRDGRNVEQRPYTSGGDTKDEWILESYKLTINPYYDQAFNLRYNPQKVVDELGGDAKSIIWKALGLDITFNEPVGITSSSELCMQARGYAISSTSLNSPSICMCPANPSKELTCSRYNNNIAIYGEKCEDCSSWLQIGREFNRSYSGNNTTTSLLFSGNSFYNEKGNICNRSYCYPSYHTIVMQKQPFGSYTVENYKMAALGTLIHEIAHDIGAPDHYHEWLEDEETGEQYCKNSTYCSDCNPSANRPRDCLMYRTSLSITDLLTMEWDELFCEGCRNQIWEHLSDHHL